MINMQVNKILRFCAILPALAVMAISLPAIAQDDDKQKRIVDIIPQTILTDDIGDKGIENPTHDIIRLTPDKSELIRLENDAASIIIGNPLHVNVVADSSRTLVIVPRAPGATHFTVLGKNGEILMQRHVIVASPKKDYMRIKRTCAGDTEGCQETSVFYCPDMCHEIELNSDAEASSQSGVTPNDGGGANNNSSSSGESE